MTCDAAEDASLEHFETTDGQPFTPRDLVTAFLGRILPFVPGAGVHQHAHDHQVDELPRLFELVDIRVGVPRFEERVDAVPDKVSPPPVGRDRAIVGTVVARDELAHKVDNLWFLREVQVPVLELLSFAEREHAFAPLSDRRERAQVGDLV